MSTGSYWRDRATPIIAEVIARVGRDDERALRKALHDAYPFGERSMHPYKIWRDEIRRAADRLDLIRYGVTWNGLADDLLLTPTSDDYWTPWHIAGCRGGPFPCPPPQLPEEVQP